MEDLISVIVPVYKVEKYLNKCIDSIINQTYKNLEIILVDDGSPDNCPQICDEYAKRDNRIKVIHKENGGLSDTRNVGIHVAKGKYIGFVDSDDWIALEFYEKLYKLLKKHNAEIAVCDFTRTNNENLLVNNKNTIEIMYSQEEYLKRYFKIGCQNTEYYAWNKLYKRNLISDNQYPKGLTSEDVVGTYKAILKSNKIVKTSEKLYFYRYNSESITGKFSEKDLDLIPIWNQIIEITKNNNSKYMWMAELNRYRIDYTLLMRMAINLEYEEIKEKYSLEYKKNLEDLKKHKKILLKSKIPFSRKITIILICTNYKIFVKILKVRRKKIK